MMVRDSEEMRTAQQSVVNWTRIMGKHMRNTNQVGEALRSRRRGLSLTQRALAQKLGGEGSHVALIESGRRRLSLKLVGRIAYTLGIDRQDLLILAHPEAKGLIAEAKRETRQKVAPSWQRFIETTSF